MKSNFFKHTKRRRIVAAVMAVMCLSAIALTGCGYDTDNTSVKTDNSVISNGSFEDYSDDEYLNIVNGVTGWSLSADSFLGSSASSSSADSGIVNTNAKLWESSSVSTYAIDFEQYKRTGTVDDEEVEYYDVKAAMSEGEKNWNKMSVYDRVTFFDELQDALSDYNDVKNSSVGMSDFEYYADNQYKIDPEDLPGEAEIADNDGMTTEEKNTYRNDLNPGTHYGDAASENQESVLMVHNYRSDGNGTAQKYTSSSSITLSPGTAAELSMWVKTENLTYNNGVKVNGNRGAFINIAQTVGGKTLDPMQVKNIDTESDALKEVAAQNNGWVKYTFYLEASPYANSTFTLSFGLGHGSQSTSGGNRFEYVQGYAFFDDVDYNVITLNDCMNKAGDGVLPTCYLDSESDERIFKVDEEYAGDTDFVVDLSRKVDGDVVLNDEEVGKTTINVSTIELTYTEIFGVKYTVATVTYEDGSQGLLYKGLTKEIDTSSDITGIYTYEELKEMKDDNEFLAKIWDEYLLREDEVDEASARHPSLDITTGYPDMFKDDQEMIVMFSANGAPYTTTLTSDNFVLKANEQTGTYSILSFWVKTFNSSLYDEFTATVYDATSKASTALGPFASYSFSTTDIDDEEDINAGWVQCFLYLSNTTDEDQSFYVTLSYGNTTITDTDDYAYGPGFILVTDFEYSEVSSFENSFCTGSSSKSVSLTGTQVDYAGYADPAATESETIKENIASVIDGYNGTYGGSAYTTGTMEDVESEEYNDVNLNKNVGVIKQKYFENYLTNLKNGEEGYDWLQLILDANDLSVDEALTNLTDSWNELFPAAATPLLISNVVEQSYGFVATSSSNLGSSSYNALSIKVYASAGAKAYIYMVNTDSDSEDFNKAESLTTIPVTYWYDDDGNILDKDPTADDFNIKLNTVYELNSNGLFTINTSSTYYLSLSSEEQQKVAKQYYANLYNYEKEDFTNNLLVNTDASGDPVTTYDYYDDYEDDGIAFYYNKTDGKYYAYSDYTTEVENIPVAFTANYARYIRAASITNGAFEGVTVGSNVYVTGNNVSTLGNKGIEGCIVVDGDDPTIANRWITVSFYVRTDSDSMPYRLEIFSGSRDGEVTSAAGSYILYEAVTSSNLGNNYDALISEAVDNMTDTNGYYDSTTDGIVYLKKDAKTGRIVYASGDNAGKAYTGSDYYCYTFYDDPDFQRYDASLDEDAVGSPYTGYVQSDNKEELTYLYYEVAVSADDYQYIMFLNDNAIDQSVTADDATKVEEDDDDNWWEDADFWWMLSSIILACVLIVVMISILVTKLIRKAHRHNSPENKYDGKRKRYIKRMNLATEEGDDKPEDKAEEATAEQAPVEETKADDEKNPYDD